MVVEEAQNILTVGHLTQSTDQLGLFITCKEHLAHVEEIIKVTTREFNGLENKTQSFRFSLR